MNAELKLRARRRTPKGGAAVWHLLVLPLLATSSCVPTTPMDAGPDPPRGHCVAGEADAVVGRMGVTECDDGSCTFGGGSCGSDADCFAALSDGALLPAWVRPQGGIGTRFNVRADGVIDDDDIIESMRILIVLERSGVPCDVNACAGLECPCDAGAGEACLEEGGTSQCAAVLVDQTYRNFPTECRGDDAIHIEEIPIQFRIGWALEQVDGRDADVEVHLGIGDDVIVSPRIRARLEVGDFIYPASFDPLSEG